MRPAEVVVIWTRRLTKTPGLLPLFPFASSSPAQQRINSRSIFSYSVYVHAAIANGDAGRGVFRGHPTTAYAPQLGDIIHHNRMGGTLSFEFARAHTGYPSHGVIVVDFETTAGVRHAITIGGNEGLPGGTGTVGRSPSLWMQAACWINRRSDRN